MMDEDEYANPTQNGDVADYMKQLINNCFFQKFVVINSIFIIHSFHNWMNRYAVMQSGNSSIKVISYCCS